MRFATFLQMQGKRLLKNRPFLLMLLLFPVCLLLLSQSFRKEEDSRIQVGICLATEDSLTDTLYQKLLTLEDSLFAFSSVSSEEELKKQVQNGTIECGYLFSKPLEKELNKSRLNKLITVYVSEHTTCKGVLNELVYANLFEEYSLSLLQETLRDGRHLPFTEQDAAHFSLPPVTEDDIAQSYRSHLTGGSTFRFDVQFVSASASEHSGTAAATFPLLRGLSALFLLLCGFLALLTTYHDEKNGLYVKVHGSLRFLFPRLTMATYLLPSGLVCLLGMYLSGCYTNLKTELFALLCYLLALVLFYTILGTLIRNHTVLCAAFPMLLLCTLIFTPVITDLATFFPWIKTVRFVLPTYYYLLFF